MPDFEAFVYENLNIFLRVVQIELPSLWNGLLALRFPKPDVVLNQLLPVVPVRHCKYLLKDLAVCLPVVLMLVVVGEEVVDRLQGLPFVGSGLAVVRFWDILRTEIFVLKEDNFPLLSVLLPCVSILAKVLLLLSPPCLVEPYHKLLILLPIRFGSDERERPTVVLLIIGVLEFIKQRLDLCSVGFPSLLLS